MIDVALLAVAPVLAVEINVVEYEPLDRYTCLIETNHCLLKLEKGLCSGTHDKKGGTHMATDDSGIRNSEYRWGIKNLDI